MEVIWLKPKSMAIFDAEGKLKGVDEMAVIRLAFKIIATVFAFGLLNAPKEIDVIWLESKLIEMAEEEVE